MYPASSDDEIMQRRLEAVNSSNLPRVDQTIRTLGFGDHTWTVIRLRFQEEGTEEIRPKIEEERERGRERC